MREKLINDLLDIIQDYRMPKDLSMDNKHIERWISQFSLNHQEIILRELIFILKKQYFSRNRVKESIRSVLTYGEIWGDNKKENILNTSFLRIQEKGNSQKDLLELVDEVLEEEYNIITSDCFGDKVFFYIDDCVFTGNRFIYDIKEWADKEKLDNDSILISYHIGCYKAAEKYYINKINEVMQSRKIRWFDWRSVVFNNFQFNKYKNSLDILWPKDIEYENLNSYVNWRNESNQYAKSIDFNRKYDIDYEKLFSCKHNRDIVESEFLKVGLDLVMNSQSPASSVRPMGFSKLESIGFGSMFITYRNISNNCPLALWYGDVNADLDTPLGRWYPLFPRVCELNYTDSSCNFNLNNFWNYEDGEKSGLEQILF